MYLHYFSQLTAKMSLKCFSQNNTFKVKYQTKGTFSVL